MCSNVRFQMPLGQKIFTKMLTLTKIGGKLMMWTTWGMGHKIEYC
jgi:hypothetical protein